MMTASAITDCVLLGIEKPAMMAALHKHHDFSEFFTAYVLSRNIRYEADLVDQLFNSSEKRLARVLLLLSRYGKDGHPERVVPKVGKPFVGSYWLKGQFGERANTRRCILEGHHRRGSPTYDGQAHPLSSG
jgi:hypothetical protein